MEKYAVDLEKVLDDFEFEEKHLRKYSSEQRAIDDSLSCDYTTNENIYPRAYRTPAANYRRPPFEPMNLADADFSVSQISRSYYKVKTSDMQTEHESNFKQSIAAVPRSDSEFIPTVQHSASIDYSFTFNLKDKNDYKPDLIESNAGICSNSDEFSHIERHLPDIASADMISTVKETSASVDVDGNENGDLFEGKNMLPTQMKPKAKVISFQISQNVTDDALHQYLEELVEDDDMNSQNRMIEKSIETPEDSADMCSITELEGKVGKETECSSSDNLEAPKSSCSSENCDPDYGILSDNVLLISSSVESQENLEYDNTENDMEGDRLIPNNDAKYVDDPLQSNVPCVSCADYEIFTTAGRTECTRSCGDGTLFESAENQPGSKNARPNESESDFESEKFHQIECIYVSTKCVDSNVDNVEKYSHSSRSAITGACERYEVAEAIDFDDVGKDKDVDDDSKERKHVDIVALPAMYDNKMVEHDNPAFGNPSQIIAKHKELNTRSVCDQNFTKLESKMAVLNFDPVCNILNAESQIMESSASLDVHYASTATLVSHRKDDVNDDHEGDDNDNSHERDDHEGEEHFTESETGTNVRSAESLAGTSQAKPQRPDFLDLPQNIHNADMSSTSADSGSLLSAEERKLGKEPPYWMPDSDTIVCMHCQLKFNPVIRRRHHCRACGLVVCAKCSDRKASLEYLGFKEDRVCHTCHSILQKINNVESESSAIMKRPNPNNPMEYCSKIPPLLQVGSTHHPTPSVLVPKVGVLKREGRAKTNDSPKQVIFSDGIRPGGDLTELDASPEQPRLPLRRSSRITKRVGTPPAITDVHRRLLNPETRSFIPSGSVDLPPLVTKIQGEYVYSELETALNVKNDAVEFAINRNLFVVVCRLILDCCVHKEVWCVTSEGLSCVGQDEIVFIVEALPEERHPPKDVFTAINTLYQDASKGSTVTEMSYMPPHNNQLFGSKEHGGFVFIRPTYQCVQKLRLPKPPFLIALLIHRWETPWARLFPIRLVLRLGAEYRYYPCPLVSVRNRPALFSEIGHTIFTLLADFRKYTYTLPTVRGLMIHMEDRLTTILLPKNRYDQIIRALNNSEENVLAFAGNISTIADSHLVCIQSTQQEDTGYQTQAINILNKPRQVTGASFVVFNGSLKQCGWSGKSNIVEDGLMVQIPSESMTALRNALRQMKNYSIGCGPQAEEMVVLKWAPDDVNFNIGVKSEIDNRTLNGIPSIRVHNGTDYSGILRLIRWTEVFIIQSDEENNSRTGDSINISKLSESVAKSTCVALLPLLDLLAAANLTTIAVRVTIHPENVGYEAGSKGEKLPPIYMKSLDEELVGIINKAAVSIGDVANPVILELIFKVMEQG